MKKIIFILLLSFQALYSLGQVINITSQDENLIISNHTLNLKNKLPSHSNFILLPNDAQPNVKLVCSEKQNNINYETQILNIRGYQLLLINIYDYDNIFDFDIKIKYNTRNASYGDKRFRNKEWDNIIRSIALNPEVIEDFDYDSNVKNILDNNLEGCEYLIVTPNNDEISRWADTLARFRNEQGILTKVVNFNEIGDNYPLNIKDYFNDIYKNWELVPSAILLFGDYSLDETKGISSFYLEDNHPDGLSYLTDNKLVDFNNDNLPEIAIARIPAADAQQAELMVKKTIHYECSPSTNPDYYDNPIMVMGFEESRWFQLCSEVIAGYFEKINKSPNRINTIFKGTPDSIWSSAKNTNIIIDTFGPEGLNYIPSDLRYLTEWNANTNQLCTAINKGTFLVQYRGHGQYQAWTKPYLSNKDIDKLSNEDLTFVMSTNCRTGNFRYNDNGNDCFAEHFLRSDNGCVAIVAASETSFSYVNDTYVWGCYDYLWNNFIPSYGSNSTLFKYPAFANVYGKYFLRQSSWPELSFNKNVTYNLFHYFGDAFLKLNTEIPQRIDISYPNEITSDDTFIKIKKDKDTKIALSIEGKIIALSSDNDSIININPQESGSKIKVVATKQDYYRHEGFIDVKSILDNDDLFIYPNPTKDFLFVESKGINKIEIYNSIGQKLMGINTSSSREKVVIDCSTLKKGLFLLHIIYEDKRVGKSFIRL